ncbi:helix-turn-helix domain-containing protein [Cohnella sp. CFH 77786]|uniref:AraC family transcriptional regulator n=1 Tax=Cohnella sp. CFH 77786 TaxID=2662265 RepID=UPI001C60DC72|nr:AraC family transcriptional regulator [Cohnella sp. CFH 77786]MBW5446261.1 helix-turn-helix domain-containing protein [Cohnella sp. CFH 77786]
MQASRPWPAIRVLGDYVMKAGAGLGPRTIPDYELLYFPERSRGVYRCDGETIPLDRPCFILTRPGERHEYVYDPRQPSRHLFIHFSFPELQDAASFFPLLQSGGPSRIAYEGELLVGIMKQILYVAYAFPESLQRRGSPLLLSLLTELEGYVSDQPAAKEPGKLPPPIAKALELIDDQLDDKLTVESLAFQVGWSHEHLSRSFVRHLGKTPREMIVARRIERACQLLLNDSRSVKEVAYAAGFADENYFCRVFRAVKGMTATKYRKTYYKPPYREWMPQPDGDTRYPTNRVFVAADLKLT